MHQRPTGYMQCHTPKLKPNDCISVQDVVACAHAASAVAGDITNALLGTRPSWRQRFGECLSETFTARVL